MTVRSTGVIFVVGWADGDTALRSRGEGERSEPAGGGRARGRAGLLRVLMTKLRRPLGFQVSAEHEACATAAWPQSGRRRVTKRECSTGVAFGST